MAVEMFNRFDGFMEFFQERAGYNIVETDELPLSGIRPDWVFDEAEGKRAAGGYFRVIGASILARGREVRSWLQPFLKELGDPGTVALVVESETGHVLIRVKGEPGNLGIVVGGRNTRVLISAPLQFSASNLARHHGGRSVPLANICEGARFEKTWIRVSEDGNRFFEKVNRNGIVRVPNRAALDADLAALGDGQDDFAWVSLEVLRKILKAGYANSHLRSVMALLV